MKFALAWFRSFCAFHQLPRFIADTCVILELYLSLCVRSRATKSLRKITLIVICVFFFFTVPFFPFPLSSSLRFASFLQHSLLWSFYRSTGVDTCALATLCSYLGFGVFLSSANFSNSQSITPATNYSFPVIRNYCYKSLIETGSSSLIGK